LKRQLNDVKESALWEATHQFIAGSISSLIAFKKNQKYKNIFAETIRGTKNFKSNTGQKRDTIFPHI